MAIMAIKSAVRLLAGRLDGNRRVQRLWPDQLTLLDTLEKTDLPKLTDSALQAHVNRLKHWDGGGGKSRGTIR